MGLALDALDRDAYDGAVNAVAPSPARMKHFARQLGRALDRPLWMPVPGFALKAVMGEMGALVLESKRAVPRAAQRAGYTFRRPDLGAARSAAVTDAATT